jgi:hypothetical protein
LRNHHEKKPRGAAALSIESLSVFDGGVEARSSGNISKPRSGAVKNEPERMKRSCRIDKKRAIE